MTGSCVRYKVSPRTGSVLAAVGSLLLSLIDPEQFRIRGVNQVYSSIDFYIYWLILIRLMVIILSSMRLNISTLGLKLRSLIRLFMVNLLLVYLFFSCTSIVYFYLLFEISVIPIFLIVTGWGYQPERVKSAYAIIFYTIVSSIPILVVILTLLLAGIKPSLILDRVQIRGPLGFTLGICIGLGFLVKLPIYGVHIWLPLAHVEAPVYGSIILAGILLKLGGLGVIRFGACIYTNDLVSLLIRISTLGTVLVGLSCLKITDIKSVIAFSSVSHIGIVIVVLVAMSKIYVWAAVFIMLTHAFRSSGMFFGRYVIYQLTGRRNMLLNKGGVRKYPAFSLRWIIVVIARLGTPPFINLASEVYSLILRYHLIKEASLLLIIMFILGRAYHLMLYRSSQQEHRSWEPMDPESEVKPTSTIVSHYHRVVLVSRYLALYQFSY